MKMELTDDGILEELLGPRREPNLGNGVSDLLQTGWGFDENPELFFSNPCFLGLISTPIDPFLPPPTFNCYPFAEPYTSLVETFTAPPQPDHHRIDEVPFHQQDYASMAEDPSAETITNTGCCKVEMEHSSGGAMVPLKLQGQPSKNLMAERRRRKRLNDRLSMLRSIVPKISKMDRTSILGDTIDYMKELLDRINKLQEEDEEEPKLGINQVNQNEVQSRNSPKFDVERRKAETRIEICCATRPGLLLSTVSTLEALGIEIQQCVISSFSDFSMHASCSQGEEEQRTMINCEDIKQALVRNAGYGGRCL